MNPDIKAAWIAALRSGNYKQGRGRLCRPATGVDDDTDLTYCCLGVLADVLGELQFEDGKPQGFIHNGHPTPYLAMSYTSLGRPQLERAGIDDWVQGQLIAMNDDTDTGFIGIADWIKENL